MTTGHSPAAPLLLIWGADDYSVKKRAHQVFAQWCGEVGGLDQEIVDANVSNSGEALRSLARLRDCLQSLPFLGSTKVIWFRNCNFLGEDRTASAQAVTETLNDLAHEWKEFSWSGVRLLISAGKVNRTRIFYKTIDKIGAVESFAGWSAQDRDWTTQAETWASRQLSGLQKEISDEALARLVTNVGPDVRQLHNEIEKLALFVGDRRRVEVADVAAVTTQSKHARAFALGDALGDRDLRRLLRALDEELWELRSDSQKSEIGVLYGLISKVRGLVILKALLHEGLIKPDNDYNRFKTQWEGLPTDLFPTDKRFNPAAMSPYVFFKALPQVNRFSTEELIWALALLLECNQRLIYSGIEPALVLQQTLVQIVQGRTNSGSSPTAP
jgi:DNA polymerase-3 subunit delta